MYNSPIEENINRAIDAKGLYKTSAIVTGRKECLGIRCITQKKMVNIKKIKTQCKNLYLRSTPLIGDTKMEVSLISFSPSSLGTRIISAYLKSQGYKIQILCFPDHWKAEVDKKTLKSISQIVKKSSVIGVSISASIDFTKAVKVTEHLKKLNIPIIWGGTEAINDPQKCIQYANVICTGEGEETFLEIVKRIKKKKDFSNIKNLWIKKEGEIIKNPPAKLVTDLNKYPFPDYDYSHHYICDKKTGIFRKFNENDMIEHLFYSSLGFYGDFKAYHILTSRGCPNRCTFCSNNILRKRYKGKYIRKRSISNIIDELKWVRSRYSFVNTIRFEDDIFVLKTENEIKEFSKRYKKEIGLPFCINATPTTLNEIKLKSLIDCGLTHVKVGVQTGSERVLKEVYKRNFSNKNVLDIARLLHKYRHKLKYLCIYDFIFDNHFETLDDNVETLKLISQMPKPFTAMYHSLAFFSGTELYDRAMEKGYITREGGGMEEIHNKSTRKGKFNYIRFFCTFFPMFHFKIPNCLIDKKIVAFLQKERFERVFKFFLFLLFFSQFISKVFIFRLWGSRFSVREMRNVGLLVRKYFVKDSVCCPELLFPR